jgi:prephenate dehydrogenase
LPTPHGLSAASSDLFEGRPWVLTPSSATLPDVLSQGLALAEACGAVPVVMTSEEHDKAVALVSHLPQVAASLVAARLVSADPESVSLAGPGLRDVTRIAASDPLLWQEILTGNAAFLVDVLDELARDLAEVRQALAAVADVEAPNSVERDAAPAAEAVVADLLARGNAGRERLPGKHGAVATRYETVSVVVPDEPGQLARLLVACGQAGVNVEDVSIEHSEGQPVGLVELYVRPAAAPGLAVALSAAGWSVHE